jgi:hypothetical protein
MLKWGSTVTILNTANGGKAKEYSGYVMHKSRYGHHHFLGLDCQADHQSLIKLVSWVLCGGLPHGMNLSSWECYAH